jgi:polysaccharide deacetylase family protein (PEP-CTERM system associated)
VINSFTVDVEEWFHVCGVGGAVAEEHWTSLPSRVESTTATLLDMLSRHGVSATFFVVGWIAERHPQLVERIREAGHDVGSHSYMHRRVYELSAEQFARDLDRSLSVLQPLVGTVRGFRAPEWSINDRSSWALEVLASRGITYDSSMAPVRVIGNPAYPHHPHVKHTPAGDVWECPPMVDRWWRQNVPLGGSWALRMSHPRFVIHEIERRNRAGMPVTLYVHPWELDDEPPRVRLPLAVHFVHYFRLSGFRRRLDEILGAVPLAPISRVLAEQGAA